MNGSEMKKAHNLSKTANKQIALEKFKREVKRNNLNSISSNNNSAINISRSSNKLNIRK